jgi:hypothetical protein
MRLFLAMQPHLTLAGAKLRSSAARETWWEPTRAGKNTAGEIRSPLADTPPYLHRPPHRPKAHHHFRPFQLSVHSYSPTTKVSDKLVYRQWTFAAAALPPPPSQEVVFFVRRVRLSNDCEYHPTLG